MLHSNLKECQKDYGLFLAGNFERITKQCMFYIDLEKLEIAGNAFIKDNSASSHLC
jgi:hypothetical protein